ncbi:MAG: hypothetical protein AAFU78_23760, partial [Cyanobacteria bacterium J06633_2]
EPLMTFSLVDSETDQIVQGYENLENGAEIDLNGLGVESYSVVANVNSDHFYSELVESVKFESNVGDQTENVVPYALFGDNKGDYRGRTPEAGDVTIKATAYSKNGGNGKAIESATLEYTIVDTTPEPNPEPPSGTDGVTLAIAQEDAMGDVNGTGGDDVISIRTVADASTMTKAGAGADKVILYGADQIP